MYNILVKVLNPYKWLRFISTQCCRFRENKIKTGGKWHKKIRFLYTCSEGKYSNISNQVHRITQYYKATWVRCRIVYEEYFENILKLLYHKITWSVSECWVDNCLTGTWPLLHMVLVWWIQPVINSSFSTASQYKIAKNCVSIANTYN